MKTLLCTIALTLALWVPPTAGQESDALDEALALVGMRRADLGWRPKGWWPGFPGDIPYKLRAFDSLLDEPLDNITYLRSLAEAARVHLDTETIDEALERGLGHLYQAVYRLGINPKFGGLRGYAVNLTDPETPLAETMAALDLIVRQGKALYVGVSNFSGAQLEEAASVVAAMGLSPITVHQPAYNLAGQYGAQ